MSEVMSAAFWEKEVKAKLDPSKVGSLDRIVVAGMKVMFSKETHQMMLDELEQDIPMKDKLAQGITKLMGLLFQQSNGTLPPDLIIPAAGILMARAVEFLQKTGDEVTEDDFADAMNEMVKLVLRNAGASEEQVAQMASKAQADVAQAEQKQGQASKPLGMLAQTKE